VLDYGVVGLNLLGNVLSYSPIIRSMRQLPGETLEENLKRTAAYRSTVLDKVAVPSPTRIMSTAMHKWWQGKYNDDLAAASARGMFEPEYTVISKILTDPKYGGKNNFEQWIDYASKAADWSEMFSRKMGFVIGLELGENVHKFRDKEGLYTFAHNFMNEMVGNYNPRNRPAMFRGAIGLPLGAFQTFMFNYYRRLYGYVERKDFASLAAGYATQASVFGAQSVPGWGLFNSAMFDNYDGSDSLATRLDRKFPAGVGEFLMHGSLSSIPGIFGASEYNIAFYPRGSVDITRPPPTFVDLLTTGQTERSRVPAIAMIEQIVGGVRKSIDNAFGAGGFSVQQQAEILGQMTTNRFFSGVMELASGVKVDQVGQAVDAATFDAVNVASRMLGTVPSDTRRMMDAYNSQQLVQLNQQNLRTKLNDKVRSLIRGNDLTVDRLQPIVHEYLRSGGNPAYFGTWLRNTVETAAVPKAVRQLDELSRSGKFLEFMNLLTAMQQNAPAPKGPAAP